MLLLFDIDGTLLLGATDAHRDALQEALREVHGIDARQAHVVAPAGRTDGDIARSILLDAGISAERIDEGAQDVREQCCRRYAELCPGDLSSTVLPGVRELLDRLSARDDLMLSLLTGNYEEVGRLKLERAGIGHYFGSGQGAFGSDCEDRAALPAIARRRAGQAGRPYPRENAAGDRRHAARHRLRESRRGPVRGGGHGPVWNRAARGGGLGGAGRHGPGQPAPEDAFGLTVDTVVRCRGRGEGAPDDHLPIVRATVREVGSVLLQVRAADAEAGRDGGPAGGAS